MVIRNVELETVCGVTSTLPENTLPESRSRENQTWENLP